MNSDLWHFLAGAFHRSIEGFIEPFDPNKTHLANAMSALAGHAQLRGTIKFPYWNGEAPVPAIEVISCANGLLHLPTRRLLPHTPRFVNTYALDLAYDPSAPVPAQWLNFLDDLWHDDPQSIETLREIFGLLLTSDTTFQKIFFLIDRCAVAKAPSRASCAV